MIVVMTDLLAWGAWAGVLIFIDPTAGRIGLLLFLSSLFVALWGLFSVIGLQARRPMREHDAIIHRYVVRAFRQGALFAFLVTTALLLSARGWLHWWVIAALVVAVAMWEFFFLSGETASPTITS